MLVNRINDHLLWFTDLRVLICVKSGLNNYSLKIQDSAFRSDLVLVPHVNMPLRLCVFKNRQLNLSSHKEKLDQIWSEYEIVDDGWRGAVQLSESEWTHMCLTWF